MRKNSELLCDSNLPEGTHFKAISLLLFLLISGIILSLFMMLGECIFHQFNQPKIMKKSEIFRKRIQRRRPSRGLTWLGRARRAGGAPGYTKVLMLNEDLNFRFLDARADTRDFFFLFVFWEN